MTDKSPKIVPFGKYKGQPIEVLREDRSYLDWLSGQDWFRERYAGIYTLIVNNFSEVSETPDHNALQVLFLDDDFCARFATVLNPIWRARCLHQLAANIRDTVAKLNKELAEQRQRFEKYRAAKQSDRWEIKERDDAVKRIAQIEGALGNLKTIAWKRVFWRQFETGGVDVQLRGWMEIDGFQVDDDRWWWGRTSIIRINNALLAHIEIKPSVGDDYPGVLRQMRANSSTILFTEAYTGVGATKEQFIKTFALSGMKVVFRSDVDAVQLAGSASGTLTP